ncbi:hypothetical protein [Bosea sp. PAMC 26642]|uniref:hypothetical protein n=1 Tax=Bosea sp. (strain PAMC 26642) TaxID=1792307 RepID=UPI00076FF0CF|nr:hypothetical protein [Bosea sp. PAMC 26642]AMJ62539.1 hypothetical protein AXW83_21515 [Bosea sp. PAMC 26642]
MRVVLFTTTDMQSGRSADFWTMVRSVERNMAPGLDVKHYVLLQRSTEVECGEISAKFTYDASVIWRADRVSLSAARNEMLELALKDGAFSADGVVAFPDDDCWYPQHLLAGMSGLFASDGDIGLAICRISLSPVEAPAPLPFEGANFRTIIRRSTSNSIFVRSAVAAEVKSFDPVLGLGTPNQGGEDTDFALRSALSAKRSAFIDLELVGHKQSDLESVAKYYRGGLYVLARFARQHGRLMYEMVRKVMIGVVLVVQGRLSLAKFTEAFAYSARTLLFNPWKKTR